MSFKFINSELGTRPSSSDWNGNCWIPTYTRSLWTRVSGKRYTITIYLVELIYQGIHARRKEIAAHLFLLVLFLIHNLCY